MPEPTVRDVELANRAIGASAFCLTHESRVVVVADHLATARAEGFADGAKAEREECAKLAAAWSPSVEERRRIRDAGHDLGAWDGIEIACSGIAAAIRALPLEPRRE